MSDIALAPLTPDDAAWLDGWLPAVAARVGYDAGRLRAKGIDARIITHEGERAGVVAFRTDRRRGRAIIEVVATPPAHARHGIGMRAAAAIERELRDGGVRAVFAPASDRHGIAVYFWIRLGYRPLFRDGWPCERPGVIWLRRDLPGR
jgi:GNAT superfamily N-acetyltransferase